MKKYKSTISLLFALLLFAGCSNDQKKFFEDERYEKMMYVVSDKDNIHNLIYDLDGKDDGIRNIVVACSGTNPTEAPASIILGEETELFDRYNYVNFMGDVARFALKLPEGDFTILKKQIEYPAGETRTLLPIRIELPIIESLNPDKIYFIPVSIESAAPYNLVKEKKGALMRIQKKNKYGNTASPVEYSAMGYEGQGFYMTNKVLIPLTHNQVRMFIGAKRLPALVDKHEQFIKENSVIIEVASDNTLKVKPYNTEVMEVETLNTTVEHPNDGAYALYNNRLNVETTTFSVYYKYKLKTATAWAEVRESVRLPIISVN